MVLRCATEREQFILSGSVLESNEYSGTYGIRQSFGAYGSGSDDFIEPRDFGTWTGTFWCGWLNSTHSSIGANYVVEQWFESNGDPICRWYSSDAYNLIMEYWNGSAWVTFSNTSNSFYTARWDIKMVLGASGEIRVYRDSELFAQTGTIDLSHVADVGRFKLESNTGNTSFDSQKSELIWGDEITIGARVIVGVVTADGFHTQGTGTFANVDEEDPDGLTVDLANSGDRHSFTHGVLTSPPSDWVVRSVQIDSFVRNSGTGPQNARPFLRISGTDYDKGADLPAMDVGFQRFRENWDTNPATAAAWTLTDALDNTNEFGILAQT